MIRIETRLGGNQFEYREAIKRPAVAGSYYPEFFFALG